MKKFISLLFALLLATSVVYAQETPQKLEQHVISGSLEQDVVVGEAIEPIVIQYKNLKSHTSSNFDELGLTESWDGDVCKITGNIKRNLATPQQTTAHIYLEGVSNDKDFTEFTFNLLPRKPMLKAVSGELNQSVKAGESISPIVIEFDNITNITYKQFPEGIKHEINNEEHTITIKGTVNEDVPTKEYNYKVVGDTKDNETLEVSGTFSVQGKKVVSTIEIFENATQNVTAGDSIKPIVFKYTNMQGGNFNIKPIAGEFKSRRDDDNKTLTIIGVVDEKLGDGIYTIQVTAEGEYNNATASATINVTHKPSVTKIKLTSDNATQTVTAGDSIKPITFSLENVRSIQPETFPGKASMSVSDDNKTATLIGVVNKSSKGEYKIKISAKGLDNEDSVFVTIVVKSLPLEFNVVSGNENQTVVVGDSIEPIIYHYENLQHISVEGLPKKLTYALDQDAHQFKIFGLIDSDAEIKKYTYTLNLLDVESNKSSVTGTINVVNSSNSTTASSSSVKQSSSSVKPSSSSVKPSSSSDKPSSSSVNQSSSSAVKSSSSSKNNTPSSSDANVESSDSKSSSSVKSSSSKANSSSSKKSSSSGKSSSSKNDKNAIVAVNVNPIQFNYVNNELMVAAPMSSSVRVQVFDLTGQLVESFAETVSGSKNFSLAHLNKGHYVVRIESNRLTRTAKVAVK